MPRELQLCSDKVIHQARVYASKTAGLVPAGRLSPGQTVLRSVDTLSLFSGSARGPHPDFLGSFAERYGFISARLIRNAAGLSDTSEASVRENLLFLAAAHFKLWILFAHGRGRRHRIPLYFKISPHCETSTSFFTSGPPAREQSD